MPPLLICLLSGSVDKEPELDTDFFKNVNETEIRAGCSSESETPQTGDPRQI